ncbi:O-antigen polysaccharide polymerase Wzy family protein [Caproiciproducens galactitolivorans]|uniref:O-antigen polysaccharide polymerase Wzy family protein n=1 Tax=Caproiciproducens galactitolivorans TaxID=642589 RepID=A0ABT4BQ99_9FIRM|nr:O-antigen polysaccharide polymerase Wzy family protein [Caproiciproducens galactitolivorans]MCY1713076.1 O-antigen polysaccharide polymerase Wzy family protein [Caproiciproducens galactitolivorans]
MIKIKSEDFLRDTILFGITILLMLTSNLLTVFGVWNTAVDVLFFAILFLDVSIAASLIHNVRRDLALLIFLITYNVLLMGRVFTSWFGYHHKLLLLLEADDFQKLFQSLQLVALSLFCVYCAYRLAGPIFHKREAKIERLHTKAVSQSQLVPIIRQLSAIVLYVSSVPFLYILFKTALAVVRHGYLQSFTSTTDVPSIISRLSMFFVPAFAVFLATLPSRKQIKLPLAVYSVYMLASLFTGRRNTIVCEALMLAFYFVMRDSLLEKDKRVLKKRTVAYVGVLGIIAMYGLQFLALVRSGAENTKRGLGEMLVSFIDSQGASFRVVVQTVNHIQSFNPSTSYMYLFYPFELFVHNNVVTRTLFGLTPIIEVQTSEFVQTTHNFGHALTYMVDPERYLSGGGFGTSYVAEAYVAYGIIGVILVSAMIGLIFRFFASLLTYNWVVITCGLLAVKSFVYIPRNFAFLWVTEVFNITYICFYVAIYLAALLIAKGMHVRKTNMSAPEPLALEEQI